MKLLVIAFGAIIAIFGAVVVSDVFTSAAAAYEEQLAIARSTMD